MELVISILSSAVGTGLAWWLAYGLIISPLRRRITKLEEKFDYPYLRLNHTSFEQWVKGVVEKTQLEKEIGINQMKACMSFSMTDPKRTPGQKRADELAQALGYMWKKNPASEGYALINPPKAKAPVVKKTIKKRKNRK